MPEWQSYVREHLPALRVGPAREHEIVAELALQLEQANAEAIAKGASADEAFRTACAQLSDWQKLARGINAAESCSAHPENASNALADLRYARALEAFSGRSEEHTPELQS